MNIGMMWLDADNKRPFEEKVIRAADYYQHKYGRWPDLCFVNESALEEEKTIEEIKVQPTPTIQAHHFWLGVQT